MIDCIHQEQTISAHVDIKVIHCAASRRESTAQQYRRSLIFLLQHTYTHPAKCEKLCISKLANVATKSDLRLVKYFLIFLVILLQKRVSIYMIIERINHARVTVKYYTDYTCTCISVVLYMGVSCSIALKLQLK